MGAVQGDQMKGHQGKHPRWIAPRGCDFRWCHSASVLPDVSKRNLAPLQRGCAGSGGVSGV